MQTSTSAHLNALLTAVIDGDMSFLINNVTRQNVNYADPRYRLSLLQWAISLGRLPTVELLLARGASVLLVDGNGFSPLHRAVWCADEAVAVELLFISPANRVRASVAAAERRASHSHYTASGSDGGDGRRGDATAAHDATLWLSTQKTEATRKKAEDKRVALSWRPGAQQLVNMPHNATGRTPLMLAAVRGAAALVAFLIDECNADMYIEDKEGYTAAELAALCGHSDILNVFLAKAAGDGTGRAFQRIQQHAEDYVLTAKTVKQQQRLTAVNRRVCQDLSVQSAILPA